MVFFLAVTIQSRHTSSKCYLGLRRISGIRLLLLQMSILYAHCHCNTAFVLCRYLNINLELGIAQELVNSVHATDISGVVDESDSESESTENEVEMYFVDQFNCIIIVIMQLFVFYLLILVLFKNPEI